MLRLFMLACAIITAFVLASVALADHDPTTRSRHVEVGTGVRLHVTESGPEDGRPMLMLHGYSDSWHSWSPVLPHLPADVRAIMPDLRGHGQSGRPTSGYEVVSLAEDIVALMVRLDLRGVTLVGHSLGGFVAQEVALRAPDRITRVVLEGTAVDPRTPAVLELLDLIGSFADSIPADFVATFQHSTVTRTVPSTFMDSAIAVSSRMPLHVWQRIAEGLMIPRDSNRLARIALPTHLIWGDRDGVFGRTDQDALLRMIPGATLQVYPGTGHAPHWEEPVRFTRELIDILDGPVSARSDSGGGVLLTSPAHTRENADTDHDDGRNEHPRGGHPSANETPRNTTDDDQESDGKYSERHAAAW